MAYPNTTSRAQTCRGAGLIEVMVAVIVFSVGLIGILRMQLAAMRNAESAFASNHAALLAYAMFDVLRADRAGAAGDRYDIPKTCSMTSGKSGLAGSALNDWLQSLKATLGNHDGVCGEVDCTGADCLVRVYWDDSRATTGSSAASIEVRSRL